MDEKVKGGTDRTVQFFMYQKHWNEVFVMWQSKLGINSTFGHVTNVSYQGILKSYLSMSSCVVVLFNLFLVFFMMGSFETDWSTDMVDRDLVVRRDIRLVFVLKFRIEAKVSFSRFYDS